MKLKVEQLINRCDPAVFGVNTTAEIEPFEAGIIGQQRAVDSVNLGLRVKQEGYNIFMSGITGSGRTTYAKTIARERARDLDVPPDLCYVFNFEDHSTPQALVLPAGIGVKLREDMENLIEELKEEIPRAFESEEYEKRKNSLLAEFQEESNKLVEELEKEIREDGFILQNAGQGMMPTPVPIDKEGKPITQETFQELPEEEKKRLREKNLEIQKEIEKLRRLVRNLRLETQEKIDHLDKEVGFSVLKPIFENLKEKYEDCQEVIDYFKDVEKDIMNNLDKFKSSKEEKNVILALQPRDDESFFIRYQVNLIVNNAEASGAPVVVEANPTYYNLFGKIEGKSQFGTITTDFTMIKGGSVHKANGGYLIINARDLLQKPFAWETLKRTLLNREIVVENIGEQYRTIPITTLKPEPIGINLKVILIGSPLIYHLLYEYDEEFKKLFKVKADFDTEMERNEENIKKYAAFISFISRREKIRHFTSAAVSRVIEHSSRLTESRDKLSTRFNEILEILYEANAWAETGGHQYVEASDVAKAIEEKDKRSNLIEEKIQEMIDKGHILVQLQGEEVGQVNGLSVYVTGQYSFGKPSRITARTFIGQDGVINIEREAKMSGNIHNKGVMILSGYLGGKYAKDNPLSLSASLAFEQSYGDIDGDSASCAELIALLSAITGIPVKQNLAITGSMDQLGKVQPIGGVNEKIEGFFKVCQAKGLTGDQGVIIPVQNLDNLMLDDQVIKAVEEGKFSVYAIEDIDQAIELMMGRPAQEVHDQVQEIVDEYAEKVDEEEHQQE
jgi:lon-related putative ATP-dependent protease